MFLFTNRIKDVLWSLGHKPCYLAYYFLFLQKQSMKPFEKWKYEEVEITFGVERMDQLATLDNWLAADEPADSYETETVKRLHQQLVRKVDAWNEDELKLFFIGQLLSLVNFTKPKVYSSFSQRTIATTIKSVDQEDVVLRGRVEFFVAMGEQIPRQPFFFVNEYKPLNKTTPSDPLGQLLIAMLATMDLNVQKRPLYGSFVRGSFWYFVVLENKQYVVSKGYDATLVDDFFKILSILKRCKTYIETWSTSATER
jgi:hypothetical protein